VFRRYIPPSINNESTGSSSTPPHGEENVEAASINQV